METAVLFSGRPGRGAHRVLTSPLAVALADRYRLERELGHGAMATVFLADDLRHGRRVAIKVMHPDLINAVGPDRFLREIRIAAGLTHPNILPLYDSGTWAMEDGASGLYFVMPVVEGESLRSRLSRERQIPIDDALYVGREVAAALGYAHAHGVIHRDVKPENIMLEGYPPASGTADGWRVFLTDFGIASAADADTTERLTGTGLALGTPAYMSPEQSSADRSLDHRSDLYALGCVLYEMIAGQPPFTGATVRAVVARHALDPVPSLRSVRPTTSATLERAVTRALAKVPADRFANAAELAQALEGAEVRVENVPLAPGAARRWSTWLPPRVAVTVVAAALALAVAALGIQRRGRHRAPPARADPDLVAVLPFRTTGADPSLAYLREGMVDLLAIKLDGDGGPRATDSRAVLSAWRQAGGSPDHDLDGDAALGVAQALGAGRLIDGGVVGNSHHVTLTASVLQLPTGRTTARASVDGSPDSLPALVDRLTAQLLASGGGRMELASLTSLPALRAYFDGQRAYRQARWQEAMRAYDVALEADSTFALAGLGLYSARQWGLPVPGIDVDRAMRLAWDNRGRLSARDRTLLLAVFGPSYPGPTSEADFLRARQRAVEAVPDSPEMWYELGDEYFHFGAIVGAPDPMEHAAEAFRRSIALNSANLASQVYSEPLQHLSEIAALHGDTSELRRLTATALGMDSMAENAGFFRWIAAVGRGNQRTLDSVRSRFAEMTPVSLMEITNISQELGLGWRDAQRAIEAFRGSSGSPSAESGASTGAHSLDLNRGRPRDALLANATMAGSHPRDRPRWRVLDALYWDGNAVAGAQTARELTRSSSGVARNDQEREEQSRDLCLVEQWRLAHGDTSRTRATMQRLRAVREDLVPSAAPNAVCAAVLESWVATIGHHPGATALLDRLDSLLLTGVGDGVGLPPNIVVSRLREALGDRQGALRAIRRRMYGFQPWFLSTYLREEGRLAALTGDTSAAISAYRRYLALRSDPEAELRPQVARIRDALAELVAK